MASRSILLTVVAFISVAASSSAADLLQPPDDASRYQLGSIQVEDGRFGRTEMVISYSRVREGEGSVYLAGKSSDGPINVMGITPRPGQASGEFRLSKMFSMGRNGSYHYEFYLVSSANWAGKSYGQCLVSNVVRIGNPGPATTARPWTDAERQAYQKHLVGKKPPVNLPGGYAAVDRNTTLVPGMPIKVGYYGEWKDAEFINAINPVLVNVRFHDQKTLTRKTREGWLAVDPQVLRRAAEDPSQFSTNIAVLPGGYAPIPDDCVPLPVESQLLIGAPLKIASGSIWKEAYVLNADSKNVKVRYKGLSSAFDRENPRDQYVIDQETLARLKQPGAADEFARNISAERKGSSDAFPSGEEIRGGFARPAAKRLKDYRVSIPVPRGAQFIPEDLTLEEGIPVAGCWARKWNPVTVISENDDGTVNVHWDDYSDSWDCSMKRSQLIIQDKTVRKLRRKHGKSAAELSQTLRTWTDVSGQHKIEARFVGKTDTHVIIKTDAGREIALPLEKLCDEDQELLKKIKTEAENPFAP